MKKVGEKMGKAYKKIAITIMVGALSLVAFCCETEKKTINSNATQENKEVQIDPVVEKQMKENEKNGNLVGNISNQGKMAESKGWIYYSVNGDKNTGGIYRTKDQFQTSERVVEGVNASYINIKNKALYFIHTDEEKNAGVSSLMKYDISNKKLDTLKADTNYVYIKDQTLFYPKKYSEHGGFDIVGIAKINLKTGQEEEAVFKNSGWSRTIDDSILHWNKNRGTQMTKDNKTWSKENYATISSATYNNEKLYAVVDFSLPFETNEAEHGIYEIDVQQNNEKLLVKDALQMNVKGDTFYYLKKDGVYKKKINGGNEKVIYNKAFEPTKSYLYFVAGDMYLYTDNGTIMNLDTKKSSEVKDKKLADNVMLQKVWNAQKELTNVQMAALTGNPKRVGDFSYGELVNPIYNKKDNLETTLSTYFSKSFIAEYMKSKYIKELNGKMHYAIGDPGSKAATKFTKIISAELKDGKIKAQVETYNDYDNVTETVEVEFIYEHNQWVINNMPRFGFVLGF